jgi:alpha-D-ribose 1-methylphosphonate 5-triphosphate synthase subunit PhnH
MITVAELPAGFADKVLSAQSTFRSVMDAMGRPGTAQRIVAATGAPVVEDSSVCSFALIGDARVLPALDRFAFGTNEYPDRSTTLILQVESLTQGSTFELRGPGIDGTAVLQAAIQPPDLFERLAINAALFPRGIDVVLVADDAIVAIPRTTRLVAKGG